MHLRVQRQGIRPCHGLDAGSNPARGVVDEVRAKLNPARGVVFMKENYVRVCPKCGSTDVAGKFYGFDQKYFCKSCGFEGLVFPEVEKKD